jgi:hypothetical protein
MTKPPRSDKLRTAGEESGNISAHAYIAVHQQCLPHRPSAGNGWLILRRSARPPRAMLSRTATEDMSTPSAARP